jgi:hypothetical protein
MIRFYCIKSVIVPYHSVVSAYLGRSGEGPLKPQRLVAHNRAMSLELSTATDYGHIRIFPVAKQMIE